MHAPSLWTIVRRPIPVLALLCALSALLGCAKQPASLSISSKPEGATVFLDWKYIGVTPIKGLAVTPGAHAVRIEKRDHRRWSQIVRVQDGPTDLQADLETMKCGRIEIVSAPSGASVCLAGEPQRGKTPMTLRDIPYGAYQVLITADQHDPWTGRVDVNADVVKVKAILNSQMADYYRRCIEKNPNDIFSRTELAHHYAIRKEFDKALEHLTEALKTSSKSPQAVDHDAVSRLYQELAKIYVGWFDFATESEITQLRPRIEEIVQRYGNYSTFGKQVSSWGRQKDPQHQFEFDPRQANMNAIRSLEKLLQEKPNDVSLLIRISELHLQNYSIDQARDALERAQKVDPQNFAVHMQLSAVYRRMGKHEDADRELELATTLCKDPVERGKLHETLAGVYQAKLVDPDAVARWYPKAVAEWVEAIKLAEDPDQACQRRFRLALLYKRMGENDKALTLFQAIVDNSKKDGLRNYAQYFLSHSGKPK